MPKRELPHDEQDRLFNKDQYDMLMRCSQAGDMSEWNSWFLDNLVEGLGPSNYQRPNLKHANFQDADLGGAVLNQTDLSGANLRGAYLSTVSLGLADLSGANLQGADLRSANLEEADLRGAILNGANLSYANLKGANLHGAKLRNAALCEANLQKTILYFADFQSADMRGADFQRANLTNAKLQGADLKWVDLKEAQLLHASLEGADFSNTIMDHSTLMKDCAIDRNTYFVGAGLESARKEPKLRASLEGNIRRIEWERWYKKKKFLQWLVRPFWWVSDYGMSTGRVLITFLILAIAFGLIYYLFPDLLGNLKEVRQTEEPPILVSQQILPVRALYFSVVTMTTLGFGDIYANPNSVLGHILLILQVILGYFLLGALVTRLAVLFNSLGPAQKYAPTYKKKNTQQTEKRES